jgi:transcriptional regulator with XRE-family HTH domain
MQKDPKLGKRIAWLRINFGMEQKEAADKIGIIYGTYQPYEYGKHPSRRKMEQILSFYRCSSSWLLTGEGVPYPEKEPQNTQPHDNSIILNGIRDQIGRENVKGSDNVKISDDLTLAAKVLESGTSYATALHLNIRAFARSIQAEERIAQVERNQLDFERKMQSRMEGLEKTIKRLEVENKALKGCAGDSPPFSLSPANCAPTGTEDPET